MRPLVVDTSIWIEWLRGNLSELREKGRDRTLYMPATVALELYSGAPKKQSYRVIHQLIETFVKTNRIIVPGFEEYRTVGSVLADLGWPASKKSNDALIVACARRIGAEIWTNDHSDFRPLAKTLLVPLGPVN